MREMEGDGYFIIFYNIFFKKIHISCKNIKRVREIIRKHDQYKILAERRKQWIIKAWGLNNVLKKHFKRKEIRCEIFLKVFGEQLK